MLVYNEPAVTKDGEGISNMDQQTLPRMQYRVYAGEEQVEGFGTCQVFGIRGLTEEKTEVFCIGNVTVNEKFAEKIVNLLTLHQVSAIHARDVIEDLIAEYDAAYTDTDSISVISGSQQ